MVPYYECDGPGLALAYGQQFPFIKDGLLFMHKAGHYEVGLQPTPLALLWKDQRTSRYAVNTKTDGQTELQSCCLELSFSGGALSTLDGAVLRWYYIEGKRANEKSEGTVEMAEVISG